MKRGIFLIFSIFFFLCLAATGLFATEQDFLLLHEFENGVNDGEGPFSQELVGDADNLYGMTYYGGTYDCGIIYSIKKTGTDFTVLHSFRDNGNDGGGPYGALILSGEKLYGMTSEGGDDDLGVIFSINKNGTDFALLYEFDGTSGSDPRGSLTLVGSKLYGMTMKGGSADRGVIFSFDTADSTFSLLHEFQGFPVDGAWPTASLVVSESKLYGMTYYGGSNNQGVIFEINIDGTEYAPIRDFEGGANGGHTPYGSLIVSDSKLYGMTSRYKDWDIGVIFSMNKDGSDYRVLHEFAGLLENDDGRKPKGTLAIDGSKLYGTTLEGGEFFYGVLFSLNTDGTGYEVLRHFKGGVDDGLFPGSDALLVSGSYIYGVTSQGGDANDGVIYRMKKKAEPPPPPVPQCFINTLFDFLQ